METSKKLMQVGHVKKCEVNQGTYPCVPNKQTVRVFF